MSHIHKFNVNFFVLTGRLASDPTRAEWLAKDAVHIGVYVRDPYSPYEEEHQEKYFYPLDLYAKGVQGELLMRHWKKGMYVTLTGRIVSMRAVCRGRPEGVPHLIVDELDLKWYIPDVPTAEEMGLPTPKYRQVIDAEPTDGIPDDSEPAPKKKKFKY